MRIQTRLGFYLDKLSAGMMIVAMLMLAAMTVLMNVEVIERSLFKSSTMIADEYSGYFFSWLFLCALLHVQRSDGLLKVDALADMLRGRVAVVCDIAANLVSASVTAILTWACTETVLSSWQFGSTSLSTAQTPLFIPQCIMPLGLGLVTLSFLETAVSRIYGIRARAEDRPGAVI